jgi:hypothetical protein
MKTRFFAGCVLLVALSVATFWLTRSVVGQARRQTADTTPRASTRIISETSVPLDQVVDRMTPAQQAAILNARHPGQHWESSSTSIDPNEPAPVPRHKPGELYEASMNKKGLDVQVAGHDVQVMARVGIYESLPQSSYTWCLRLWTAGSKKDRVLLNEVYYHHQAFTLTYAQNVANPTFAERLTLEPGKYRIEVKLFSFPPDFDKSKLEPGVDSRSSSSMGGSQEITVAD